MKTKLNLICILLFCAMGISFSLNLMSGIEGFYEGWNTAMAKEDKQPFAFKGKKTPSESLYATIRLTPVNLGSYPDSLYNQKTHNWIPVQYNEFTTFVEKEMNFGQLTGNFLLLTTSLIAMLMGFLSFIRLIRNINKSYIFEWANVRQLKLLGYSLLITFAARLAFEYLNYANILDHVEIQYYKIDWSNLLQTTNLILGLASLLVAEIFAVGLRLKEEQDLTI